MHPLLEVGGRSLIAWRVAFALACLASAALAAWCAPARGLSRRAAVFAWPWALAGAVLGGRIYAFIVDPSVDALELMRGLSIQGGIVGGALALLVYTRLGAAPALPMLDVLAPGAALGAALMRAGCLLAGCCYGRPVSWGLVFSAPGTLAPTGIALHPTQAYEGVLCLAAAGWLTRRLRRGGEAPGAVFACALGLFGAIRLVVQLFRDPQGQAALLGLSHAYWTAAAMIALGVGLWTMTSVVSRRSQAATDEKPLP